MSLSKIVNSLLGAYLGAHLLFSPIKSNAYEPLRGTWSDELVGKIHRSYSKEYFKKGSTHPYICYEASKIVRNPDLKSEIQKYVHNLMEGSIIEDNLLTYAPFPRSWHHFYDHRTHEGLKPENFISPSEYYDIKTPLDAMSSLEWALSDKNDLNFNKGVEAYERGNLYFAYKVVGAISHLIQDNTVPAHAKSDVHPNGESYEKYCGEVFNIENLLSDRTPDYSNLEPIKFNSLEEFFNHISSISGEFDSDNTLRKNRQSLSKSDLAYYSETLIPLAIQSTAGFLEYFYEYVHNDKEATNNNKEKGILNKNNLETLVNKFNNMEVYWQGKLIRPDKVSFVGNKLAIIANQKVYMINLEDNGIDEEKNLSNLYANKFSFCNDGSMAVLGVEDGSWKLFKTNEKRKSLEEIALANNKSFIDLSKDCSEIVFAINDRMYLINPETNYKTTIFKGNLLSAPQYPKFSKDGSKILFVLKENNKDYLCIINKDGGMFNKLKLEGDFSFPLWKNDNEILFVNESLGNREVFSYNLNKQENPKKITSNTISEYSATISDDEKLLLVCGERKTQLIDLNNLEQ